MGRARQQVVRLRGPPATSPFAPHQAPAHPVAGGPWAVGTNSASRVFIGTGRVEGPSRAFNRRRVAARCEWRLDRLALGRALARQARAEHAQDRPRDRQDLTPQQTPQQAHRLGWCASLRTDRLRHTGSCECFALADARERAQADSEVMDRAVVESFRACKFAPQPLLGCATPRSTTRGVSGNALRLRPQCAGMQTLAGRGVGRQHDLAGRLLLIR